MVMPRWSVNLTTLFLGRLRPEWLTSTWCTSFHQLLTTARLETAVGQEMTIQMISWSISMKECFAGPEDRTCNRRGQASDRARPIPHCVGYMYKSLHGHKMLKSLHCSLYGQALSFQICWCRSCIYEPRHVKTNKMNVRPAKTYISLGIRAVWSVFSLSAWRKFGSLGTHWAHSEDSDQTGRMPRLI